MAAFGDLIERHWQYAFAFARRMLSFADAEDVVQEALLAAFLNIRKLRDRERFRPWLLGIEANLIKTRLRQHRNWYLDDRFDRLLIVGFGFDEFEPSPELIHESAEFHRVILHAIDALSPEQNETVRLHYFEGLKLREIAILTGEPVGTLKARLHHARLRMKLALASEIDLKGFVGINEKESNEPMANLVPFLPIRELICFPHERYPIYIGRAQSIKAVSAAQAAHGSILLVAQKDGKIAAPSSADMYAVGTLGVLVKLVRLEDGTVKALIEGKKRARVANYAFDREFFEAEAEEIEEAIDHNTKLEELRASVVAAFVSYARGKARISAETAKLLESVEPSILSDKIAGHLKITLEEKQALLESTNPVDRLEKILRHMQAAN